MIGSTASADTRAVAESQSMTYETAAARVEEIVRRLDSGEASLNETLELVREGKTLIEFCAGELESVGAATRGAAPGRARRAPRRRRPADT